MGLLARGGAGQQAAKTSPRLNLGVLFSAHARVECLYVCVCMRGPPRPETLEVGLGRRKSSLLFVPVKGEYMLGELVVLVAVSVATLGGR